MVPPKLPSEVFGASPSEPHASVTARARVSILAWAVMASLMASCSFALLTYVLIAVGAFLALLRVAFVILLHPFQALKRTPRDGKQGREGGTVWTVALFTRSGQYAKKKNAALYMYKPAVGISRLFPRSSSTC